MMSNKQLAAVIARRKAIQKNASPGPSPLLAACVAAAGYDLVRSI